MFFLSHSFIILNLFPKHLDQIVFLVKGRFQVTLVLRWLVQLVFLIQLLLYQDISCLFYFTTSCLWLLKFLSVFRVIPKTYIFLSFLFYHAKDVVLLSLLFLFLILLSLFSFLLFHNHVFSVFLHLRDLLYPFPTCSVPPISVAYSVNSGTSTSAFPYLYSILSPISWLLRYLCRTLLI